MTAAGQPGPLSGLTVLDLTQIYNGPYAAFLLGAAGAEVIKIEPPGGEHLRRRAESGFTLPFAALNAGKRSLRLDLKDPRGREILQGLARGADVLVENFAPGVMDRLGVGAAALQALNPRLIYACSSGYGATGPYRDHPAMDLTVQAMAGIMAITGTPDGPPLKAGPAIADFMAGIHLYGAIVTALLERERTGTARAVEVSMLEANVFPLLSALSTLKPGTDPARMRVGNRHGGLSLAPYNVYACADGHVAILVGNERHWAGLLRAFGQEAAGEDPRFRTNRDRCANMDALDALVGSWTAPHPKQHVFEMLSAARVPAAPVRLLNEVIADPHLLERGALAPVEHPEYGPITLPRSPLRFAGLPAAAQAPTGALGAEGRAVLAEKLGLDAAALDRLQADGVI